MHVLASGHSGISLFALLACMALPVAGAHAQGDQQANSVSVPTPVTVGSSRVDVLSVARGLGLTNAQVRAITAIRARHTSRRNALVEQMVGGKEGSRGADNEHNRAIIMDDLHALAQLQQQDIEAVLTPAQLESFRRFAARSTGMGVIPAAPPTPSQVP